MDEKVADADAKLRDFMAEIESMDEDTGASGTNELPRSTVPGFVSGGHVLPAAASSNGESCDLQSYFHFS